MYHIVYDMIYIINHIIYNNILYNIYDTINIFVHHVR